MNAEGLLERFGYLAIFIGTLIEGETFLVVAGFFAERGYLSVPLVIVTAFVGSLAGNIFWFWLGRSKGLSIVRRYPKIGKHLGQGVRLFERWGAPTIFISQFLYGIRISCAIIVGLSNISIPRFLFYQTLSCLSWSFIITGLGYYFGKAIQSLMGRVAHVEKYALVFILVIAAGVFLRNRRLEKKKEELTQ